MTDHYTIHLKMSGDVILEAELARTDVGSRSSQASGHSENVHTETREAVILELDEHTGSYHIFDEHSNTNDERRNYIGPRKRDTTSTSSKRPEMVSANALQNFIKSEMMNLGSSDAFSVDWHVENSEKSEDRDTISNFEKNYASSGIARHCETNFNHMEQKGIQLPPSESLTIWRGDVARLMKHSPEVAMHT